MYSEGSERRFHMYCRIGANIIFDVITDNVSGTMGETKRKILLSVENSLDARLERQFISFPRTLSRRALLHQLSITIDIVRLAKLCLVARHRELRGFLCKFCNLNCFIRKSSL